MPHTPHKKKETKTHCHIVVPLGDWLGKDAAPDKKGADGKSENTARKFKKT